MGLIANNVRIMQGYVPGEQPQDVSVLKLNTNENPYPPSPMVFKTFKNISIDYLRKYPDPLCKELREEIASSFSCSMENVFIGNGSDEILALASRAFVENTGSIGYVEPSYSLYKVIAQIRNVKIKPIFVDRQFKWSLPKSYKVSLFYFTNPNAPSGIQYDFDFVQHCCSKMSKNVLIIDEAYVDFAKFDCLSLAFRFKNVLILRTLSKSYSLAGLRVGFAIGNKQLINALFKVKDSYNVDYIAQKLAIAAIRDKEYLGKIVKKIIRERERLSDALKVYGFEVLPSQANFLFARPPKPLNAKVLFEKLRSRKIYVRYFPGKITGDGIRITIGTPEQMNVLINEIKKLI